MEGLVLNGGLVANFNYMIENGTRNKAKWKLYKVKVTHNCV